MLYHEYYTWQCYTDKHIIGHSDGSCSLAFVWDGIDHKLYNPVDYEATIRSRLDLLNRFSQTGLTIENHWFRASDSSVIDAYIAKNKDIVRGKELAIEVRRHMADHYRPLAMSNRVLTVFTLTPKHADSKLFAFFSSKSQSKINTWSSLSSKLHQFFSEFKNDYPGIKLLGREEFYSEINRCYSLDDIRTACDNRYDMAEQIVTSKPALKDQCLNHKGKFIKHALIQNIPSLEYDWMLNFSSTDCQMHICQVFTATDRLKALRKSSEQSDTDERTSSRKDVELLSKGLNDAQKYRNFVAENNLSIFNNTYIVSFVSDKETKVLERCSDFTKFIGASSGLARVEPEIQMHLHRISQLGLGHLAQFSREDHSLTVASMFPWTVFNAGHTSPESIRLTSDYQTVGFSPSELQVGHEIGVGKTGGGKDTHIGTEVLETFPFGLDYYILEFGDSYKWIVEGYGGTYSTIDPDKVVINPLPDFSDAKDGVLPSKISSGTAQGLAIILLDDVRDLSQAELSAAERALSNLYRQSDDTKAAPTLPDLLSSFKNTDYKNESQAEVAKTMSNNLENFLDSSNGRAFKGQDNLSLSDGITGIDLLKVDKKMLKFYLTFICLRFAQKAFFNLEHPTKIILNELHEAIDVAPDVVKHLIRTINRMGRKEGSFITLITQGMNEIHAIDSEIVTSSPIRTLLVRTDAWNEIGNLLDMPAKAIETWSLYHQDTDAMRFRQCMRKLYGTWFDLYLTFPQLTLDITSTSRKDRIIKQKIEAEHSDIFTRINTFREMKEATQ